MSEKYKTCKECNGTGIDELDGDVSCWSCDGEGVVRRYASKPAEKSEHVTA